MQTTVQGSYTIRYTWIYSTEKYRKVAKRVESSADFSAITCSNIQKN